MKQVYDSAFTSVPQSLPHGVDIESHWHLNETEWEHGRDDTLCTFKSPGAVVKGVVGCVVTRVVVLVTREKDLRSREYMGLSGELTIATYSRLSFAKESSSLSTSENGKVVVTVQVSMGNSVRLASCLRTPNGHQSDLRYQQQSQK